jgi:hypothetical protein
MRLVVCHYVSLVEMVGINSKHAFALVTKQSRHSLSPKTSPIADSAARGQRHVEQQLLNVAEAFARDANAEQAPNQRLISHLVSHALVDEPLNSFPWKRAPPEQALGEPPSDWTATTMTGADVDEDVENVVIEDGDGEQHHIMYIFLLMN